MLTGIPCTIMRGGTSKGLYFSADDLPADRELRDRVLLAAMGSPDIRQIDGLGGAHPLTSKVAIVRRTQRPDADVDYLFLQVVVDKAEVSDSQNCGNILAGIGPWSIEQGLVAIAGETTPVRIHMVNTGSIAVAHVRTPAGAVEYEGDNRIDGVPGTAAAIPIDFVDVAGSSCGALLPTGSALDVIDGVEVTCIDNGMPVVILRASDFGRTGEETPAALESDAALKARIENIRLQAGPRMNLGDVASKTVPKMCLVSPPRHGGVIATRTFIPHRVHEAIGVLGAVSVATACVIPGSIAETVAAPTVPPTVPGRGFVGSVPRPDAAPSVSEPEPTNPRPGTVRNLDIEHPTGFFTVEMDIEAAGDGIKVKRSALVRTARLLMRGEVFVPGSIWRRT